MDLHPRFDEGLAALDAFQHSNPLTQRAGATQHVEVRRAIEVCMTPGESAEYRKLVARMAALEKKQSDLRAKLSERDTETTMSSPSGNTMSSPSPTSASEPSATSKLHTEDSRTRVAVMQRTHDAMLTAVWQLFCAKLDAGEIHTCVDIDKHFSEALSR